MASREGQEEVQLDALDEEESQKQKNVAPTTQVPESSPAITKREEYISYALLLTIHFFMALFFVLSRWALSSPDDKVNPNVFSALRLGFAAIIVTSIMKYWLKDLSIPTTPLLNPITGKLLVLGIFGGVIPITLFSMGVSLSSAINAAIISVCQPVFTAGLAIAIGVDAFMPQKIVGIIISIAGALYMLDLQNFKLDGATLGNVLLLIQQAALAVYNVTNRNIISTSGLHYGVITAWTIIIGSSGVILVTLPSTLNADNWHISTKGWLVIAYAALFASSLYFGFSYILKRIKPTVFSSFVTLQPVLAGLFAYLMLGESFGWHQLIGAALVITGLFVVVTSFDFVAYFKAKSDPPTAAAPPAAPAEAQESKSS